MTTRRNNQEPQEDFVLKHRVAGAAFLLFFGALILPWLLGPPSEAVKAEVPQPGFEEEVLSVADVEEELLAAIEREKLEEPEQIYISKITPLDTDAELQPPVSEPDTSVAQGEQTNNGNQRPDNTAGNEAAGAEAPQPKPAPASKPESLLAANDKSDSNSTKEGQAAARVEVGWVVQVGLYTDPKGAARVVDDLRSKGFEPSTSIVDTKLGAGTGTRVWLGPFAQRVDAAKTKTQLKDKTGEAGFIRAYP